MRDLMTKSHGTFGSALGANSEIIEKIDGIKYEYPAPECGCHGCDEEYDEEYEDDEDEDDDGPPDGVFVIRRVG